MTEQSYWLGQERRGSRSSSRKGICRLQYWTGVVLRIRAIKPGTSTVYCCTTIISIRTLLSTRQTNLVARFEHPPEDRNGVVCLPSLCSGLEVMLRLAYETGSLVYYSSLPMLNMGRLDVQMIFLGDV